MEAYVLLGLALAGTFGGGLASAWYHGTARAWQRLGAALGLQAAGPWRLSGSMQGFSVHIAAFRKKVRVEVYGVEERLVIRAASRADRLSRSDDVETGDAVFDELVAVRGDPHLILALLDSHLRPAVARLVASGTTVALGRIVHEHPGEPEGIEPLVRSLVSAAAGLTIEKDQVPDRLALNLKDEALVAVRERIQQALRQEG